MSAPIKRVSNQSPEDHQRTRLPVRQKNRLIFELLHGISRPEHSVMAEARSLHMDLTQPRAVILVDASDYILGPIAEAVEAEQQFGARVRSREVVSSIVSFFMLPHEAICADLGDGVIAVLKASNSRNLDGWLDEVTPEFLAAPSWANLTALKRAANDLLAKLIATTGESVSIGIGRYHSGNSGLATSFTDARTALTLGRRIHGPNRVHCLDDLGIGAFVGLNDEGMKAELAHHLLSPLDHDPELLKTLTVFFTTNCSMTETAQILGLHRNTLAYRLAKVASATGLDPRHFDDAVQIRIALVLRNLGPYRFAPALFGPDGSR
jgi:carbohydrate diacid regulator